MSNSETEGEWTDANLKAFERLERKADSAVADRQIKAIVKQVNDAYLARRDEWRQKADPMTAFLVMDLIQTSIEEFAELSRKIATRSDSRDFYKFVAEVLLSLKERVRLYAFGPQLVMREVEENSAAILMNKETHGKEPGKR